MPRISASSAAAPGAPRSPASRAAPAARVTLVVARSGDREGDRERARQPGLSARASPLDAGHRGRDEPRRARRRATCCCWSAPAQAVRELAQRSAGRQSGGDLRQGHRGLDRAADAGSVRAGAARPALSRCCRARASPRRRSAACRRRSASPPADPTLGRDLGRRRWRPARSGPTGRHDVLGVALGGAVKNVLAIAAGIVEGRGLGHNAAAALVTRGFAEMARLGQAMGARARDADRPERPRRPGADLPRPAVAQPLAGPGAGQGHDARRLHAGPPPGGRGRGDGAGGAGARGAARHRDADLRRGRCYPASRARASTQAIRGLLARPLRRERSGKGE